MSPWTGETAILSYIPLYPNWCAAVATKAWMKSMCGCWRHSIGCRDHDVTEEGCLYAYTGYGEFVARRVHSPLVTVKILLTTDEENRLAILD